MPLAMKKSDSFGYIGRPNNIIEEVIDIVLLIFPQSDYYKVAFDFSKVIKG